MRSGRAQKNGFRSRCRTLGAENAQAGFCASNSDSIVEDSPVASIPNFEGQRQTMQAGLKGTIIPCLQATYNQQYFAFWNQPVAAKSEHRFRHLKIIYACPEKAGVKMATLRHFCASLLYGVFSEFLQTQNAVSKANPEV
jgi:hypothetical protein